MRTGIKIAVGIVALVTAASYFLLRPTFINGTIVPETKVALQTHFGFCFHPFGTPLVFRTTLVRIDIDAKPTADQKSLSTTAASCREREGFWFGLLLPKSRTYVVKTE